MNYTKGEWKVAGNKINSVHIYREECPEPIIGLGSGVVICGIRGMGHTSMADAQLIASAPDMYEVLKEFVETATITDPTQLKVFNKMKKAIAKAEGK